MLLTLCLHEQVMAENSTPQQRTQTTMHAFFQALTNVFPWSLDAQQFQAPEQRPRIQAALQALAQHAEYLDTHGQDVPQSFGFLRRSRARSAHDAAELYARGSIRRPASSSRDSQRIALRATRGGTGSV